MRAPAGRELDYEPSGMVLVDDPNEIADRILDLHERLGHGRQILQMDVGGMPHATFLKGIDLLGTAVLPRIRKELEHIYAQTSAREPAVWVTPYAAGSVGQKLEARDPQACTEVIADLIPDCVADARLRSGLDVSQDRHCVPEDSMARCPTTNPL